MRTAIVLILASCTTWKTVREAEDVVRAPERTRIALRDDDLPGSCELLPDGTIGFLVDVVHACRAIAQGHIEHITTRRQELSDLSIASLAVGAALGVIAIACCTRRIPVDQAADPAHPYAYGSTVGAVLGTTSLIMILGPAFAAPKGRQHPEVDDVDIGRTFVDLRAGQRVGVDCDGRDPLEAYGELELTTPWGDHVRATADAEGVARFVVDWSRAPGHPLVDGWLIQSSRSLVSHTWRPTINEQERMRALSNRPAA